jgi:serine/threonine protein kinase
LNAEQNRRVTQHFLACIELSPARRADYLNRELSGEPQLRASVEAMLAFEAKNPSYLESGPAKLPASDTLATPTMIGGFRIISCLGEGGMGTVFEAEQEHPQRRVAVKVLRGFSTPSMQRRFEFESELLGRLHHPGIAQIFEAGTADSRQGAQPYFAMELIRGKPITEHARAANLGIRQRLELVALVCDAVQHAHQRGVIHRDLKPGNILVDEHGQPKVLDFGVARVTDSDLKHATLQTATGQVIGTLQYMSPEQASGNSYLLDTRADVYALGVIAFEMLTEQLPYDLARTSIAQAARIILEVEPTAPGQLRSELRGDLETILLKALEKDKERRYPSAAEFSADLRRYLRKEPIAARPASRRYRLEKFASRNKSLLAALLAIAASLVAATIVSLNYAWSAERQRDSALLQKARAQERLEDVRALANSLLFDVHDSIAPLAGSTPVRERLVATALAYLSKLRAQAGDDLRLIADVAGAYIRVGDIQGHPRRANLGRTEEALLSYAQSLELLDPLIAAGFDAPLPQLTKAELLQRIGAIRNATGEHDLALEAYEQSAALLESLAASNPRAAAVLSTGQAMVGGTFEQLGRLEEALAAYQRAFSAAEKLAAANPLDERLQRDISVSCNEVGLILQRLGRIEEAQQVVMRGLLIREALAAKQPDNARAQRDLALSRHRVGALALQRDDAETALLQFEAALKTLQSLADSDPRDNRARYDLSVAQEKLGSALLSAERNSEALIHIEAAKDLRRELVAENPANQLHANGLASSHERLARVQRRLGEFESAELNYRTSMELATGLLYAHPDEASTSTVLSLASFGLAELLLERTPKLGSDGRSQIVEARELLSLSGATLDEMARRGVRPTHGELDSDAVQTLLRRCEQLLAN